VHGAERPLAQDAQQLKPAEFLGRAVLRVGGGIRLQAEAGPARRASDLLVGADLHDLDGVVTMGTEDVHDRPPFVPRPNHQAETPLQGCKQTVAISLTATGSRDNRFTGPLAPS